MGFHLLYPAKRPDLKVDVVMGGIATNTISHRAFKGRQQAGIGWVYVDFDVFLRLRDLLEMGFVPEEGRSTWMKVCYGPTITASSGCFTSRTTSMSTLEPVCYIRLGLGHLEPFGLRDRTEERVPGPV